MVQDTNYGKGRLKALKELQGSTSKLLERVKKKPVPQNKNAAGFQKGLISAYSRMLQSIENKINKSRPKNE